MKKQKRAKLWVLDDPIKEHQQKCRESFLYFYEHYLKKTDANINFLCGRVHVDVIKEATKKGMRNENQ